MDKLTDAEIIKALECCIAKSGKGCSNCPYHHYYEECRTKRNNDCIDLINRQKAEIERLQKELEIKTQKRANIFEISDAFARGESKGRKEFADRLREKITDGVPFMRNTNEYVEYTITVGAAFRHIQNLLEEMEGEGK